MTTPGPHRVVITDCNHGTIAPEREVLDGIAEIELHQRNDEEGLLGFCRDADAIITQYGNFTRRVLRSLRRCRVIARYGVGVDTIDLGAATDHGIIVAFVPDYCTDEVSNHAVAMVLALHRGLLPLDRAVRAGNWEFRVAAPIRRLSGQTLGLVGIGRIGLMVARKLRPFGLSILAADPSPQECPDWIRRVSLDELLGASDIVSIHCPLTSATRRLIGAAALRRMKPTAFLVNTARGGVVDTEVLAQALRERWIAGAALDVLEEEPMPAGHPLIGLDNVILNPHAGWYSEDSIVELKCKVATAVRRVLEGKLPEWVANPEALNRLPWLTAR
jgi:D-3-phosphoglycerate dehydrogenase